MAMRPVHKRYARRLLPAMPGYCALIGLLSAGVRPGVPAELVALRVLPCFFWIFGLARPGLVPRLRRG